MFEWVNPWITGSLSVFFAFLAAFLIYREVQKDRKEVTEEGELLRKVRRNRTKYEPTTNILTIYDDDGVTPFLVTKIDK